jgi:hypothetical protein
MNPRVSEVRPTDDYKLELVFSNGEKRLFDCAHLLEFGVFRELQDIHYFKQVKVEYGTVAWPHEQDICPDTLYLDSRKISAPSESLRKAAHTQA